MDLLVHFPDDKQKWNEMMRSSMQTAVNFTAHRMIIEYQQKFYQKHHKGIMNSVE